MVNIVLQFSPSLIELTWWPGSNTTKYSQPLDQTPAWTLGERHGNWIGCLPCLHIDCHSEVQSQYPPRSLHHRSHRSHHPSVVQICPTTELHLGPNYTPESVSALSPRSDYTLVLHCEIRTASSVGSPTCDEHIHMQPQPRHRQGSVDCLDCSAFASWSAKALCSGLGRVELSYLAAPLPLRMPISVWWFGKPPIV